MRVKSIAAGAAALAFLSSTAGAQSLLTSNAGYTGPVLSSGAYAGQPYTLTAGPIALPGGITYSSTSASSVIGSGSFPFTFYTLFANGFSTDDIIGTNSPTDAITLTFSTPVSSFGAEMNYAPGAGDDPVISAYDASGALIASYDLATDAPITANGIDGYEFRGIDGAGTPISSFTLAGSYIIAQAPATTAASGTVSAAPEPGAWMLMITGLALMGVALQRRRSVRPALA